jgi:hypothetical protein
MADGCILLMTLQENLTLKGDDTIQARKLTRKQKQLLDRLNLNPNNWLRQKETSSELIIVHRYTDTVRTIRKELME